MRRATQKGANDADIEDACRGECPRDIVADGIRTKVERADEPESACRKGVPLQEAEGTARPHH